MPNLVKSINLTDGDKATLESILHQSTVEARTYPRTRKRHGQDNQGQ